MHIYSGGFDSHTPPMTRFSAPYQRGEEWVVAEFCYPIIQYHRFKSPVEASEFTVRMRRALEDTNNRELAHDSKRARKGKRKA